MPVIQCVADCPPLPEIEGLELRHCSGFPGYAIGNDGSLWSCRGLRCTAGWKRRKMHPNGDGYYKTDIRHVGRCVTVRRASLVAIAWHGPRPDGQEVRHKDGTRDNDVPENLEWGTHRENIQDAVRHGTFSNRKCVRGEQHGRAKLTEQDVRLIRMLGAFCTQNEIAALFGIVKGTVGKIVERRKWQHI